MSDRMVIRRKTFVLSMDPEVGAVPDADILVEGGVIREICPSPLEIDAVELDTSGNLAIPRFVDTHRHLWNSMLKRFLPNCIVADYAEKVGVRRLREQFFSSDDQLLGSTLAARGPGLPPDVAALADWALGWGLEFIIGIHCDARWPGSHHRTVPDVVRLVLLGPDVNYVHLNKTPAEGLARITVSGGPVSITPLIEMMAGHGHLPIGKLLGAGLRPTLSVDAVMNVPGDMFSEERAALSFERVTQLPEDVAAVWHPTLTPRDVLEFATIDDGRAMRRHHKRGSLRRSKDADIVLIRADKYRHDASQRPSRDCRHTGRHV